MNIPSGQGIVLCDADNTLWDTNSVFASAQLAILGWVEAELGVKAETEGRLEFVRDIDQTLAERHHAGLRYPPRYLARAIALRLNGLTSEQAARLAWRGSEEQQSIASELAEVAERNFLAALDHLPELREGVRDGLEQLHAAGYRVVVVTEGARDRVQRTLRLHRITRCVDRVIEAPKQTSLFRRIMSLGQPSSPTYMIGDQLERDIRPAKEVGLVTIYFPGGFNPRWDRQTGNQADFTISSFAQVLGIVQSARQLRIQL